MRDFVNASMTSLQWYKWATRTYRRNETNGASRPTLLVRSFSSDQFFGGTATLSTTGRGFVKPSLEHKRTALKEKKFYVYSVLVRVPIRVDAF